MANAERLSVSVDGDLIARMKQAGLSPSALLTAALRHALGDEQTPAADDRLAALEKTVKTHARQLAQLRKVAGL